MRVVVTGASGNLGSAVVRRLRADPAVTGLTGVARRRPRPAALGGGVRWIAADVGTDDLLPLFRGVDAVVHLAWQIQPSHDPGRLWRTNVVGTERVADAAARAGVPVLVHTSSVGAYSPAPEDARVDESWPTSGIPTLGYSWQKAYAERVMDRLELSRPDMRVVRIRPGLIFQRPAATGIRLQFAGPLAPTRLLPVGPLVDVVRGLPVPFQVVHADDVAAAFQAALHQPVRGAFNVAAEPVLGRPGRPGPVLAAARAATAALWRARLLPTEPGWIDLAASAPLMDCGRAGRELSWRPRHDAVATLRELLSGMASGAVDRTPPLEEGPAPAPAASRGRS